LIINYFVPQQVEANHPVKLGVIVQNVGSGPANDLVISSGQPVITNNASGLLVTFALLGAEVGGQPQVQHSLTLNLGTIPGGGTAYGYWLLNADLSGEFTAFTASYTEQPFAGVQLSPLIVGVHTNLIVQGDVVPAGGEDLQVVTQDLSIPPSILLDLESGVEIPVTTIYVADATLATLASPVTTFSVAANGGYVVAVVPDALPSLPISSVHASYPDGSNAELFTGNNLVWRNVDPQGPKVNLVDQPKGSPGQTTTYGISYSLPPTATLTPTPTPTATDTPALIPGGGRIASDCTLEWATDPRPLSGRNGLPGTRLDCTDGDPTCDFDQTQGTCTFHVGLCLNVQDARFPCTPTDVRTARVVWPGPGRSGTTNTSNRTALETALGQVGGQVEGVCTRPVIHRRQFCTAPGDCDSAPGGGNGVCFSLVKFSPPLSATNACTGYAPIAVPVRHTARGSGAGTKRLRITAARSVNSLTLRDIDSLTLVCHPRR
jgi:hypothetical protein